MDTDLVPNRPEPTDRLVLSTLKNRLLNSISNCNKNRINGFVDELCDCAYYNLRFFLVL